MINFLFTVIGEKIIISKVHQAEPPHNIVPLKGNGQSNNEDHQRVYEEATDYNFQSHEAIYTGSGQRQNQPETKHSISATAYSLAVLPEADSPIVVKEKVRLLGVIDLEAFVDDLGRLGNCVRIAYHSVTGFIDLQIEIQRIGYDVTKLCDKSAITVGKFKSALATVLSSLKAIYEFLLESFEDMALDTLADVADTAKGMAIAAEELHRDFDSQANKVIEALERTQQTQDTEDKKKKKLENDRNEMEEKKAKQEKLKHLEIMHQQQEMHSWTLAEYAKKIQNLKSDENQVEMAIDALQKAIEALKSLAAIMMQAALFWQQFQAHCEFLSKEEMKKMIEKAVKLPEPRRLKFWDSTGFKNKTVQYYAGWVALDHVCGIYMERIRLTQCELYTYIQEALHRDEARKKVKELTKNFAADLESQQKAIAEKKAAHSKQIQDIKDEAKKADEKIN